MLNKEPFNFEIDIWALGCILYAFLTGVPPFETETAKDTYKKIRKCKFTTQTITDDTAISLIKSILIKE